MKYLYIILFIIPLIFTSCDEEEIQPTMLTIALYGNWESVYNDHCYTMTLSSNGQFVYQFDDCVTGEDHFSNSGLWWTEENHLVLSGDSWGLTDGFSVSGNSLEFNGQIWDK